MTSGQFGPFTSALLGLATVAGAGILFGGFAIGMIGLLLGRSRKELAERALTDGYAGGVLGLCVWLTELVMSYGVG